MTLDIFGTSTLDEATRRDLIRKELLNLTTSYSDEADIFAELVQNAVDAITTRPSAAQDDKGELTIVIGRRKNNAHYFYVQDNGVGMDPDIVEKVFIPSFSYGKAQGKSIGYKVLAFLTSWPCPIISPSGPGATARRLSARFDTPTAG
jgi:nitrogen-specific signal transduction histidine kinase